MVPSREILKVLLSPTSLKNTSPRSFTAGPSVVLYPPETSSQFSPGIRISFKNELLLCPEITGSGQSFQRNRIASGNTATDCFPLWPPSPQRCSTWYPEN